jgi:predicted ATPase with chaperone activity
MQACAYVGPAPVVLSDYIVSVDAQTIRAEAPKREQLEQAFHDISIDSELFDHLGPAINSGAGLFLYGAPGNGKTTLAQRITACFGQDIWIPRTLIEDGQLIKFFDAAYHTTVDNDEHSLLKSASHDRRWIKVSRPTVIVGGELTMNNLEIEHDSRANVGEAPLQLKSNCGCLLIDDFGRQRIEPMELLNRWIVPLENRIDYLTLATGKKIQVPFEQLIIFSTNLDPADLTDDAFLRRIPYKIQVGDPSDNEFFALFRGVADLFECAYDREAVEYLLEKHYRPTGRARRRCHPRDLLLQIRNYCTYNDLEIEMRPEYFDRVVKSYFTTVSSSMERCQ